MCLFACGGSAPRARGIAPGAASGIASGIAPAGPAPSPTARACVNPGGATYPWRYHALVPAEREARRAAFASRNAGTWSTVQFKDDGLVFLLESTDPAIVAPDAAHPSDFTDADLVRWSAFLRDNAEFFGITDPASVRLVLIATGAAGSATHNVAELRQYVGDDLHAEVAVLKSPPRSPPTWQGQPGGSSPPGAPAGISIHGALDPIAACPRIADEALAARLLGARYLQKSSWSRAPRLDCNRVRNSPSDACESEALGESARVRTADRASIYVGPLFVQVPLGHGSFEERHVACVGVHFPAVRPPWLAHVGVHSEDPLDAPRHDDPGSTSTFTPLGKSPPLPLAVDRVTGEALDARLCPGP